MLNKIPLLAYFLSTPVNKGLIVLQGLWLFQRLKTSYYLLHQKQSFQAHPHLSLKHVYIIYNFLHLTTWHEAHTRTTGRSSHPHALHKATLGLSVKGLFYCHATGRLTLALTGEQEQGQRARGPATPLHTQGFIVITVVTFANAKLTCWYETALKHNLCIVQYHIFH